MSAPSSVPIDRLISTHGASDAIRDALSEFIGAPKWGKIATPESVAQALTAAGHAIKGPSVSSWLKDGEDRRTPPGDVLLMLCDLLGPSFTSKLIAAVGQVARSMTPDPADPGVVVARLSTGLSAFAVRGADGRFCHVDEGELEPVADEMIQILEPFSSRRG